MGEIVHCFVKSTFIYICDNVARLKRAGERRRELQNGREKRSDKSERERKSEIY